MSENFDNFELLRFPRLSDFNFAAFTHIFIFCARIIVLRFMCHETQLVFSVREESGLSQKADVSDIEPFIAQNSPPPYSL